MGKKVATKNGKDTIKEDITKKIGMDITINKTHIIINNSILIINYMVSIKTLIPHTMKPNQITTLHNTNTMQNLNLRHMKSQLSQFPLSQKEILIRKVKGKINVGDKRNGIEKSLSQCLILSLHSQMNR